MAEFNIGERLRRLRQQKNLSLRELSRRSGVSATQISEIERNLTAPTVPTLMKIIAALGANTSIFFQDETPARISLVRKSERTQIIDRKNNVFIESLTTGITGSTIKAIIAHPQPGVVNIPGGYKHAGEELIYVIKGAIEINIEGETYILNEGDCIHFHGELRHTIKNISGGDVEVLSIVTPPNY